MKYEDTIAILVKAVSYRDNLPEMAKFIRNNKRYFPKITEEELQHLENEPPKNQNRKSKTKT